MDNLGRLFEVFTLFVLVFTICATIKHMNGRLKNVWEKSKAIVVYYDGQKEITDSYSMDQTCWFDYGDHYRAESRFYERYDSFYVYRIVSLKFQIDGKETTKELYNVMRKRQLALNEILNIRIKGDSISII